MTSIQIPAAKTTMWIRCAVADAFRSFIACSRFRTGPHPRTEHHRTLVALRPHWVQSVQDTL